MKRSLRSWLSGVPLDREMRVTQWLEELRDDVKFAARQLRAAWGRRGIEPFQVPRSRFRVRVQSSGSGFAVTGSELRVRSSGLEPGTSNLEA